MNHTELEKKIDRHEELLGQMGEHLSDIRSDMNKIVDEVKEIQVSVNKLADRTEPVIIWFSNINFLKTVAMWTLGFIATLGAALAVIKGYFKE